MCSSDLATEVATDWSYARIGWVLKENVRCGVHVLYLINHLVRVLNHGAEFDEVERNSVDSYASGLIEDRHAIGCDDDCRNDEEDWRGNNERKDCKRYIETSFHESRFCGEFWFCSSEKWHSHFMFRSKPVATLAC